MLGNFLSVLIGPTIPVPAPQALTKSLEQVSVQLSDEGRSGFQMSFRVGRDHTLGIVDYPQVLQQLVRPGNRVVLTSVIDAVPHVLVDGIITNLQLSPSIEPAGGKLSVSGQDLSILMEQQEFKLPRAPVTDQATVMQILGKYAALGLVPVAIVAPGDVPKLPTKQVGVSDGTDFKVVTELGRKYNYVFWLQAGPLPTQNLAYWGPPIRIPIPQRALAFRAGAASNLGSVQFTHDGTKAKTVVGMVQDQTTNAPVPVVGLPLNVPPLASLPAQVSGFPLFQVRQQKDSNAGDTIAAYLRAAAVATKSSSEAITASGELDVTAYGSVLRARELVGVRGVGLSFDGLWYVKSVSHTIMPGSHKQSFNLTREGTISSVPMVRP